MAGATAGLPLPNLLVVGMTKAGTTSLFRYLAQHAEVCASDVKEPRYFEALMTGEPLEPLENYGSHFAHCRGERFRMEASPGYFEGGRMVASAIDGLVPDARVVVSFRDPVQRCWSWYRFLRSDGRIAKSMSFEDYIDRCEEVLRRHINVRSAKLPFGALGSGCYDNWLEAWTDVFGTRFRVEFFDDLVRDPRTVVVQICEWLGLDPETYGDFEFRNANKTARYRLGRLHRRAMSVNRSRRRFLSAHPVLKRGVRGAYMRLNRVESEGPAERMDDSVRERLESFYAPHNERLADLLTRSGRVDLPGWLATQGGHVSHGGDASAASRPGRRRPDRSPELS